MTEPWLPAEHGSDGKGLGRRVARGFSWTVVDNWGAQLLGLVILVVLLRLLDAEEVGLVALATAFVALAQLFVDQGLGDALIQRPSLTRRQIDTAFWTAVATGALLTLLGFVAAGPLGTLLSEPRLTPIVQALSITFLMTAFSSIQMALLRREMAFRSLAARRLIAIAGGGGLGIAAAFMGFGAWALVVQQLAQAAISVVTLWAVSPWRPALSGSWSDFRSLFGFGANIVAGDLLFYLGRRADAILIGAFLGSAALGLYAVGYRVLEASTAMLITAARKLAFPTFARLQGDSERLVRAYGRMSRGMAAVTLPGYIGLALIVQEVIVLFAGERWSDSGPVATVLVLTGPALAVQAYSGGLLNAVGRPDVTLRYRFLAAVLNIAGFLVAVVVFRDIVAVAAAYALRGYVLAPVVLRWLQDYAGIPFRENLQGLGRIVLATALMATGVLATKLVLADAVGLALGLALQVLVGIVVYTAAMLVLERALVAELWRFGLQALPGGVARRLDGARASLVDRLGAPSPADELRGD